MEGRYRLSSGPPRDRSQSTSIPTMHSSRWKVLLQASLRKSITSATASSERLRWTALDGRETATVVKVERGRPIFDSSSSGEHIQSICREAEGSYRSEGHLFCALPFTSREDYGHFYFAACFLFCGFSRFMDLLLFLTKIERNEEEEGKRKCCGRKIKEMNTVICSFYPAIFFGG